MEIMLLTYRSFMTPKSFFECLVGRFNSEPPENATEDELRYYNKWIDPVRIKSASFLILAAYFGLIFSSFFLHRVLAVLQEWISLHWHDFEHNSELRHELDSFVSQVLKIDQSKGFEANCSRIQELMSRQVGAHEQVVIMERGK